MLVTVEDGSDSLHVEETMVLVTANKRQLCSASQRDSDAASSTGKTATVLLPHILC